MPLAHACNYGTCYRCCHPSYDAAPEFAPIRMTIRNLGLLPALHWIERYTNLGYPHASVTLFNVSIRAADERACREHCSPRDVPQIIWVHHEATDNAPCCRPKG